MFEKERKRNIGEEFTMMMGNIIMVIF